MRAARGEMKGAPHTRMGTNPMKSPDQDLLILIRAIDDARLILREFIEPGPSDAMRTVERLLILLDRNDVVHALDRTKRRRLIRLIE
jgi:hypothetical protein